jgi:RHS repeat-associated protein
MLEERDASGAVTRQFFPLGEIIGGTKFYFAKDHLGSVRSVTDASGNDVADISYDSWGRPTVLSGSFTPDFGFCHIYVHQRSGLNLTMFRAYSPALGRWLSRDPLGELAGTNLYAYCGNNPISFSDPSGLDQAVIVGDPAGRNPFGHAADAVTGAGVYSYGTGTDPGTSLSKYLLQQSAYRGQTVYVIPTSKTQDQQAIDYFNSVNGVPLPPQLSTRQYTDNCSIRTNKGLDAAGVPRVTASPVYPKNLRQRADAAHPSYVYNLPKGTTTLPPGLEQFEPKVNP